MNKGYRIARIFGINIRVDWSWLLIVGLITWDLATVFAQVHSDWGLGLDWGLALVAALLFFVSVLLHELAHSLVAKAHGIPVRSIRLFLFGGVSNIEREPESPGTDLVMAFVGPLTSIVLGIILLILGGFALSLTYLVNNPQFHYVLLTPLTTLLLWLGSINLILGVFNLIPGFPLDGGRILRSIFWAISGNLRKATHIASWIGQLFAWLLALTGAVMLFGVSLPVLGGGLIAGVWLIFIAWFLHGSAVASYRQVSILDFLEDVPVTKVMVSNPTTVSPDMTVDDLIDKGLITANQNAFPVVENGRLLGMISIDNMRAVARDTWGTTTVRQIMVPDQNMDIVDYDDDAADALNKLQDQGVRQLPVVQDGALVGLLRRQDIVKWLRLDSDAIFN